SVDRETKEACHIEVQSPIPRLKTGIKKKSKVVHLAPMSTKPTALILNRTCKSMMYIEDQQAAATQTIGNA
ncbi:MAG: hypothetical protein N0E48_12125, partial [Candidatus Thiodiazotropha endolucinida]|nr:hypothetical protein [Candidatus Thiodiazotropha taylori]MCW4344088.1 hypothetical protein [Candidatus Thiodiazotropha endolucinida]